MFLSEEIVLGATLYEFHLKDISKGKVCLLKFVFDFLQLKGMKLLLKSETFKSHVHLYNDVPGKQKL